MIDRTYIRVGPDSTWHAFVTWTRVPGHARVSCGRTLNAGTGHESADRVPSSGHLCGNCSRVIAASTDVET